MLRTIFKYPLEYFSTDGTAVIEVPYHSRLLSICNVGGQPVAYYEVDAEYVSESTRIVYYLAVPTGKVFEYEDKYKYYSNVDINGLVVHFYINSHYEEV